MHTPTWTGRENYKGYTIAEANKRGGKAGRNKNVTSTIQVRYPMGDGYLIKSQFRYTVGSIEERNAAVQKARRRVDLFLLP